MAAAPRAPAAAICCLLILWLAAPWSLLQPAAAARVLHAAAATKAASRARDWGDSGDPSGLGGILAARVIAPQPASRVNRVAVTPEMAEATSAPGFLGVFRPTAPDARRSYATVEGVSGANPDRRRETVRPRARSAQDIPRGLIPRNPDIGVGTENVGAVTMGTIALSETFEGAEAVAASDAVAMASRPGGRKPGSQAASMLTARPPFVKRADAARKRSSGLSAGEPVNSLAGSGPANGKIVLAQAEYAVAMAQTQRSNADSWNGRHRRRRR